MDQTSHAMNHSITLPPEVLRQPNNTITQLPSDAIPIDIPTTNKKHSIALVISRVNQPPEAPTTPTTWQEYIHSLQQFEHELLQNITTLDIEKLTDILHNDMHIYLASNSGAVEFKSSFKAVIATTEEIIVELGSQAQGEDP